MISANALLTVKKTSIGDALATSTGRTVYWYGQDVAGSGKSACTGGCLMSWPAVTWELYVGSGARSLSASWDDRRHPGGVVQATYARVPALHLRG